MCAKDENGSRRHQFVSEETSKAEMREEAPIHGIRNFNVDGDEKGSSCNNEMKNKRCLELLASDIAYDNHRFQERECNSENIQKSRDYLQHTTANDNPSSATVDTRAIGDSEIFGKFEEANRLSVEQKTRCSTFF